MTIIEKNWQTENLTQFAKTSLAAGMSWQKKALQQFNQLGWPTRRNELWKYNDLSALKKMRFSESPMSTLTAIATPHYFNSDCYRLVFINGVFHAKLSNMNALPAGVLITDLRDAIKNRPQLIENTIANSCGKHFLHHLNAALLTGGAFILLEKNVVLTKPLHLLHLQTHDNTMNHPRHIVIGQENSAITVFEEYQSTHENNIYFNNVVTHLIAKKAAHIQYYKLQQETRHAVHVADVLVEQAKDSSVEAYQIDKGAKLARLDMHCQLNEPGAHCALFGFYQPGVGQYVDNHLLLDHKASHTTSKQEYRGMMAANSHAVFNGKIVVHNEARHCVAHQQNKNLMLASSAEIDTLPQLEIYNDDVQCSHGATIGRLDEQALFYLRSRGIEESVARYLLTNAFAADIINKFPEGAIKNYFKKLL